VILSIIHKPASADKAPAIISIAWSSSPVRHRCRPARTTGTWIGGLAQGYVQESMHPNTDGQEQLGVCLDHMATRSDNYFDCGIDSV
jgi:hypothetical protein